MLRARGYLDEWVQLERLSALVFACGLCSWDQQYEVYLRALNLMRLFLYADCNDMPNVTPGKMPFFGELASSTRSRPGAVRRIPLRGDNSSVKEIGVHQIGGRLGCVERIVLRCAIDSVEDFSAAELVLGLGRMRKFALQVKVNDEGLLWLHDSPFFKRSGAGATPLVQRIPVGLLTKGENRFELVSEAAIDDTSSHEASLGSIHLSLFGELGTR
jgi:hypothetical protein